MTDPVPRASPPTSVVRNELPNPETTSDREEPQLAVTSSGFEELEHLLRFLACQPFRFTHRFFLPPPA
jgi:hypothetical protein